MDFDLPADDDPRRLEVRAWLAEHPEPTNTDLAEAGSSFPTGLDLGVLTPTRCTS